MGRISRRAGPRPWRRSLREAALALAASLIVAIAAASAGTASVGTASVGTASAGTTPAAARTATARTQAAISSGTSLWPRFSAPRSVIVANTAGMSGADLLTAVTLEGVYNGEQHPSRLYLIQRPEDRFWLTQLPESIRQRTLTPSGGQTQLEALLREFKGDIRGAVVTDPSNADTGNLATTLAGIDHAVVIDPGQESLVESLGIPVLYSFDTPVFSGDDPARTYEWGVANLLPKTSRKLLVMLSGTEYGDIRDYSVATGAFIFWLTSTNSSQEPVMNTILTRTPPNTPVMGYVPDENPDVADISASGHFLNASDKLTNESFWASIPSPPWLRARTGAAPLAARPGTVYVAFLASDGDNAQYMQQRMAELWNGPDLGALPMGWTVAPGTVDFDPTMLRYYTGRLPADEELDAGPSGIGYTSQLTGPDLTRFGQLTGQILARDGLRASDSYEPPLDQPQYARAAGPPLAAIAQNVPLLGQRIGGTYLFGQTSGYVGTSKDLFCTAYQQDETARPDRPLFLEPLYPAPDMTLPGLLEAAQSLAAAARKEGLRVVFTTPTELELTMERYDAGQEAGLPAANVQSMTGAQVLARPPAGALYPTGTVRVTGPNLVTNPSGASGTRGWGADGGTLNATAYQGRPALKWTSDVTTGQSWVYYDPAVTDGGTYTFSLRAAGEGQVYLDVYNGTADFTTLPARLTPRYRTFTWTETIGPSAPPSASGFAQAGGNASAAGYAPSIQLRESGAGPVTAYISGASVAASTPAC